LNRFEKLVSRYLGTILNSFDESYGIYYGLLVVSGFIMALILIVVEHHLPAAKMNIKTLFIFSCVMKFIFGMTKGECAVLELDLNKKPLDLNEEPESSESNNLLPNTSETGPSAPVDSHSSSSIAYEEMVKLKDECQEKILRCWRNEPKYEKRRLNPSGSSMDASISAFILQRWQGSSLESIRSQRNELSLEKGSSEIYMEFRAFLERCNT